MNRSDESKYKRKKFYIKDPYHVFVKIVVKLEKTKKPHKIIMRNYINDK